MNQNFTYHWDIIHGAIHRLIIRHPDSLRVAFVAEGGTISAVIDQAQYEMYMVPTLAQFEEMCRQHDLTYQFSDDHSVWRRGEDSYNAILAAASKLPRESAAAIWNKIMNLKLLHAEDYAQWRWI